MTIEMFRDLVISITGIVLIGVLIFGAVIAFSLYRRLRQILDSLQAASAGIEKVVTIVADGILEPLSKVAVIIQGIYRGICAAFHMFKGGKDNG
jgi:hypothetical protein